MRSWLARPFLPLWPSILTFALLGAVCGDDDDDAVGDGDADADTDGGAADAGDDGSVPACEDGTPVRAFAEGGTGSRRRELAGDFTVELTDGSSWTLSDAWTGCESYVFSTDLLTISSLDERSVWEEDLDYLLEDSPRDVHYFFVSGQRRADDAQAALDGMTARIEDELAGLDEDDAAHWRAHLHVVADRVTAMGNWIDDVMDGGIGWQGFAIDRFQRIRGTGSLADVQRYDAALAAAEQWPWEASLSYLANEPAAFDAEVLRQAALDAVDATIVTFWEGEVLSQFEEIEVELPTAQQMATFDTFEIDVTSECPDQSLVEPGNCGAWDYLAHLFVYDGEDRIELGRFITTYHRESRWIVDATPMLVHLRAGGTRQFRWEFAPEWNVQPTRTTLSLRFSNQGKPVSPASATFLFGGGTFNADYNDAYEPIEVDIPADAERVELWAIVTGHGAEDQQCAEFCDHQHELTVDGEVHVLDHPTVGDNRGCVDEIARGMTPNQFGTWWFGRGGWCPGMQVEPWVVDVTSDVTPGEAATIEYRGLLNGAPPSAPSGNIVMTSYLVVYR